MEEDQEENARRGIRRSDKIPELACDQGVFIGNNSKREREGREERERVRPVSANSEKWFTPSSMSSVWMTMVLLSKKATRRGHPPNPTKNMALTCTHVEIKKIRDNATARTVTCEAWKVVNTNESAEATKERVLQRHMNMNEQK